MKNWRLTVTIQRDGLWNPSLKSIDSKSMKKKKNQRTKHDSNSWTGNGNNVISN